MQLDLVDRQLRRPRVDPYAENVHVRLEGSTQMHSSCAHSPWREEEPEPDAVVDMPLIEEGCWET